MSFIVSIRQQVPRLLAIIAVAASFSLPGTAQSAPIVMKIGTATINDTQYEWMKTYAALVDKNSKGRIKVELYPSSQLGSIPREIEGTQFGSIQGWVGPPDFLAGVASSYEALGAPGLFKDLAHASRTLQDPEFNKAYLALGANKGLKGVALFLYGAYGFNTKKPVHKLADLKGMKIRVTGADMQMKQVRLLGASPVPMTLGDVAAALQQGTIDGQMAAGSLVAPMHFYDVAKYMFTTDQSMVTSIAVISKLWYDKLPADLQKVVTDAGQQATRELQPWTLDFIAKQSQAWIKGGGELNKPTAAEQAQLMKLMRPVGAEVTAAKPGERALYDLLLKAVKRNE